MENEITAFAVVDTHAYHAVLNSIVNNARRFVYQKCLHYNHDDDAVVRVTATSPEPIDPVAFDSRCGPYRYQYEMKKSIDKSTRHAIPIWSGGVMFFVSATSKTSVETPMRATDPRRVNMEPDELHGKYRKEFIVDRAVIYGRTLNGTRHRMAINKKCKFSGNGMFRQPDVPVYILEYEVEYPCATSIRDKRNVRMVCKRFLEMCTNYLSIPVEQLYDIIRSGQNNCLPESDLFISIMNTYKRRFVSTRPPERFTNHGDMYVCKKWDGVRAMGFWRGTGLLLYSGDFGFKHFTVPGVFAPDTIVQVEYFRDTDTFVVTEIFAVTNIEMDTDFVYFARRAGNAVRLGEGLYNGSNASIQLQDKREYLTCTIDPIDSIDCIQVLNKRYPEMFTTNYKLVRWPIIDRDGGDGIESLLRSDKFANYSDGILLKVFNQSNTDPVYYKLKSTHTVELLFNVKSQTFTSMEGTVYNDMIVFTDDFQFKYLINKYTIRRQDVTMEFSVIKDRLQFKCVRYDKIGPDGNRKIQNIITNI